MLLAPRGHWGPSVYHERIKIQLLGRKISVKYCRGTFFNTNKLLDCVQPPPPLKNDFFFLREGGGCTQANKFLQSYKELSLVVMEQFCILVKTRPRITAIKRH